MLEFDPSADIQALRSTFGEIKAVVDVDGGEVVCGHISISSDQRERFGSIDATRNVEPL